MKEKRRISTQHGAIFSYWEDKYINRDGGVVSEEDATKDSIPVVKDEYEPMCWACSKPIITEDEEVFAKNPDERIVRRLWEERQVKSGLNRCHISPDSMGGEDTPQNLFLMCGNGHIDAPDTMSREGFFRWVYRRRKSSLMGLVDAAGMIERIEEDLVDRGLPKLSEMEKRVPGFIEGENIANFMDNRAGTHGAKVVSSTYVVVFADFIEYCYKKALEKSTS